MVKKIRKEGSKYLSLKLKLVEKAGAGLEFFPSQVDKLVVVQADEFAHFDVVHFFEVVA